MTASHRPTRRRTALAAFASAALAVPALALPAAAYEPPGGERDVREFACPPGQVPDAGFTDVPEGDIFRLNINCLAEYEITQGTRGGEEPEYSPALALPRYQMAVFLVRMLEDVVGTTLDDADAGFTDIGELPPEAQSAINKLANADITEGTTETTFSPGRDVTRAQLATFVVRTNEFLEDQGLGNPAFTSTDDRFDDDDDSVHEERINALAGEGIVVGQGTSFEPNASVTRAQMAAFLTRYLDIVVPFTDSALPRDNEVLSDGISGPAPLPPNDSPAVEDQGEDADDSPQDNRGYVVSGLEEGVEYRLTLVTTDSFERSEEDVDNDGTADQVVVFGGDATSFLADPGETSAVVVQVNGQALDEPAQSVTVTPDETGGFEFTIDADTATEVAPFVYPNAPVDYLSYDPRLELAEDLRPVEVFGVGDPSSWSEPTGGLSVG